MRPWVLYCVRTSAIVKTTNKQSILRIRKLDVVQQYRLMYCVPNTIAVVTTSKQTIDIEVFHLGNKTAKINHRCTNVILTCGI